MTFRSWAVYRGDNVDMLRHEKVTADADGFLVSIEPMDIEVNYADPTKPAPAEAGK